MFTTFDARVGNVKCKTMQTMLAYMTLANTQTILVHMKLKFY